MKSHFGARQSLMAVVGLMLSGLGGLGIWGRRRR
jgi:LPXTG-motif cell wall-anchored protein